MVLSPSAVPVSLAVGINSLYKQSVLEWGTISLCPMCRPGCMVPQWYHSVDVAGALRNKCGISVNTHSFRNAKYCVVNESHILLIGEQERHRKT